MDYLSKSVTQEPTQKSESTREPNNLYFNKMFQSSVICYLTISDPDKVTSGGNKLRSPRKG